MSKETKHTTEELMALLNLSDEQFDNLPFAAVSTIRDLLAQRDELWGVLNSIRVARKMAGRGGNPYVFFEDIGKLMPRIEEVLAKAQGGTDGQT